MNSVSSRSSMSSRSSIASRRIASHRSASHRIATLRIASLRNALIRLAWHRSVSSFGNFTSHPSAHGGGGASRLPMDPVQTLCGLTPGGSPPTSTSHEADVTSLASNRPLGRERYRARCTCTTARTPGGASSSQEEPGRTMRSQEEPGGVRRSMKLIWHP